MKVQDIMIRTPQSCNWNANLATVAEALWAGDCGSLPVVDDAGKVVGMLTDRDICIALGTRNQPASEITAREVVSGHLFACAPNDEIHKALETMKAQKLRRLPVLDKAGKLQGILSLNDLALHAEKQVGKKVPDLSYEDVVETLKAICEHRLPLAAAA
ncbi:MAG: hypothetical protein A3H27_01045 [Acidobacteria bacterium RIFCSPLOWO2_02_FULL_59_13]|nr:MAG: hypothetical protein A3H27_01045 [Acidobacteria bacterium RIFCSPLOWO2_02_FULL_59_13]